VNVASEVKVKNGQKKKKPIRTKDTEIKSIFGKQFIDKLMSEIHLRLYDFNETKDEMSYRKSFKEDFNYHYKDKVKKVKSEKK